MTVSMKQYSLKVESRQTSGRRASRAQRREGKIPAVIYGKSEPRGLMIDSKTFVKLYKQFGGSSALLELEDEKGQKNLSLLQEAQRDRLTDAFTHLDFVEVKANEEMRAHVAIRTVGECIGVKMEGALLEVVYSEVAVRCLPKNLPEVVEVDVANLHAGEAIFVRDLKALSGVVYDEKADQVLITCNVPEVEEETKPTAAAEGAAAEGEAKPADGAVVAAEGAKDAKAPAKDAKAPAKAEEKK